MLLRVPFLYHRVAASLATIVPHGVVYAGAVLVG